MIHSSTQVKLYLYERSETCHTKLSYSTDCGSLSVLKNCNKMAFLSQKFQRQQTVDNRLLYCSVFLSVRQTRHINDPYDRCLSPEDPARFLWSIFHTPVVSCPMSARLAISYALGLHICKGDSCCFLRSPRLLCLIDVVVFLIIISSTHAVGKNFDPVCESFMA